MLLGVLTMVGLAMGKGKYGQGLGGVGELVLGVPGRAPGSVSFVLCAKLRLPASVPATSAS